MLHGNFDPLDGMFCIQSFDPATNTFGGSHPGDKGVYLGAMWVGEPMTGLGAAELRSFQSILAGSFPAGSIMQLALLASPDIDDTVFRYLHRKIDATHPVLIELVNRQADLVRNGANDPVVKSSGVLLCKKRLIVTLKCPFPKPVPRNIIDFDEQASKLESSLHSVGLRVYKAGASEYLMICRLITHIYDKPDRRYDDSLSLNEQIYYAADEVVVHADHLQFNTGSNESKNFYVNALSPKFLPKDFSLGLMNHVIGDPRGVVNQIRNPYFLVCTLYYPDQLTKKAAIDKKAGWINHQLFGGSAAKFLPGLSLKKDSFDVLQNEIITNSAVLVEASLTLWIYGHTLADVRSLNEDVRIYWASLGFEMRTDKLILDVLLGQSLPMNAAASSSVGLFRTHTLTSSQIAQFLPIISEWRGHINPSVLLTTRRGEVGGFDLYESNTDKNCVLIAASGSGKSFVTQRIITDYLAEGAKVWVIDSGRSYQKLAAAVGGTFMEFSPTSEICLNPFTSFLPERGGDGKDLNEELDLLAALIERMAAQRNLLGDGEVETLKRAIRQTYIEHQGYTTIQNIADWLLAQNENAMAQDLALRLDSFSYGQYSKYFNGNANVNMSNDFVVLELDDLKSQRQLQQVVLLQLVAQITNEMYTTSGRKKILIIDEAWDLLDDPVMSRAMEAAYRKARKYEGSIITVTQGLADLYKSESGQSMLNNATWRIILQQKNEAIDAVKNAGQLELDGYSYEMLKTLTMVPGSHSEMMIIGNGCCGVFRLTVDRFTQVMYSTSGAERNQVLRDIDNGIDVIESIHRLMIGSSSYDHLQELKHMIQVALQSGTNRSEIHRVIRDAVDAIEA